MLACADVVDAQTPKAVLLKPGRISTLSATLAADATVVIEAVARMAKVFIMAVG